MKTVSVILVTIAIAAVTYADVTTKEQKEKMRQLHHACKSELEIEDSIIQKLRHGEFSDEPKFKEFLYCVSKKIGFQDENGNTHNDVLIEKLGDFIEDQDKAKEVVEKCSTGSGIEAAYNVAKCMYDYYPEYIRQYS